MMDIVMVLPTCEPDEMYRWLLPSLINIQPCNKFIKFSITFQPPYTWLQIQEIVSYIKNLGFELKWEYKKYKFIKPFTPLIKMRNDCAMRYPDSDLYMLLDDDMSFNDNQLISLFLQTIDLFERDPKLGVVAFNDGPREYENYFATNAGLILRGGKYYGFKGLIPEKLTEFKNVHTLVPYEGENLLDLFGGFQDKFCAMIRLMNEDKTQQANYVPISHVENRKERGALAHGWDDARFYKGSVGQFIIKYFNKYFNVTSSMTLFEPNLMEEIFPEYYNNADTHLIYQP